MSNDLQTELNDYYNEALGKIDIKNDESMKALKLGVTITFVQSYMKSVFQAIKVSLSLDEKDQNGIAFVLETVKSISKKIGEIDPHSTIDEKTVQLIDALENTNTPGYDILKIANINVPLIETIKSDFSLMAEFLKN